MVDYAAAQQAIMDAIRPRTLPIAARFLASGEAFPEKTRRPSLSLEKRITLCQGVTMARLYGWTVGLAREDLICVPALLAWGMTDVEDPRAALTELFTTVEFAENADIAAAHAEGLNCPERNEVGGILLSPLADAQSAPDTVVIYCNPAQLMRLVQAVSFRRNEAVGGSFGGKVECIDILYAAKKTDEPRVAIPGLGDRVFSMTQDDELALTLPGELLPDLVDGLSRAARKIGGRYPIPFYQNFEPVFPPAHRELGKKLDMFS